LLDSFFIVGHDACPSVVRTRAQQDLQSRLAAS
jgi:hypothetical protein